MLEIRNNRLDHSNLELRPRYPEILRCTIRVLIVADNRIVYVNGETFGLTELIKESLRRPAGNGVQIDVTTAYRTIPGDDLAYDESELDPPGFTVDFPDFRLTETQTSATGKLPLRGSGGDGDRWNYDQVWLFGDADYTFNRETVEVLRLNEAELEVLTQFMNDGGGVFASGDHEGLGVLLSGEVPRVRSMRKWWFFDILNQENEDHPAVLNAKTLGLPESPPIDGPDRIDTRVEGTTPGIEADDEADLTPQTIEPIFYSPANAPALSGVPHPLLGKPGGVIQIMPDHMHEGDCVIPGDLEQSALRHTAAYGDEYPRAIDSGESAERVSPALIAIGRSRAPGGEDVVEQYSPLEGGRPFGLICAYEGPRAGVGRVAVQSTWHHFLNYNINGGVVDPRIPPPPHQAAEPGGFYHRGQPTVQLREIQRYHRNIVYWLYPNTWCLVIAGLYSLRLSYPYLEVLPRERKVDADGLRRLGRSVRKSLHQLSGPTDAFVASAQLLEHAVPAIPRVWLRTLQPWQGGRGLPLLPVYDLIDFILGGAINALGGAVPVSGRDRLDPKMDPKKARAVVEGALVAGALRGWKIFAERLQGDAKELLETLPD